MCRLKVSLLLTLVLACASSCSLFRFRDAKGGSVKLSQVRGEIPGTQVIKKELKRAALEKALSQDALTQQARLVQVYTTMGTGLYGYPEWRLFEIAPQSIYALLGLKSGDVLVAADDYVVYNGIQFKEFMRILPNESAAQIEIRRGDKPMRFSFAIVP